MNIAQKDDEIVVDVKDDNNTGINKTSNQMKCKVCDQNIGIYKFVAFEGCCGSQCHREMK